ncbi:MAG: DUF692 domain-containing protein [Vicingaceae bacterium]
MIKGIGLGLRRELSSTLISLKNEKPDFVEFAPENWMGLGGFWGRELERIAEKYPFVCHGLSLSIGSPDELDLDFIHDLKRFLDKYNVTLYSEHLSYSKCANAHLYDLLPIPFRQDAVDHIVERIKIVQDILERKLVLENVSYYTPVAAEMPEWEFLNQIIERSGCQLLLDVNNVYVNAFNHAYDAKEFISKLPLDKVAYIHMAGHEQVSKDLIIDTHGQAIIDQVYQLFDWTLERLDPVPVLLERDFNIPSFDELQGEMKALRNIIENKWKISHVAE